MIDQTKGVAPQTSPEPQGAAAGVRAKPAESFHSVLTNSNGDTFELPAAWGRYRAPPPAPPPAVSSPAATAMTEPQIAATDDSWRDGAVPEAAAVPLAPSQPPVTRYQANGEPEFQSPQPPQPAPGSNKGGVHAFAEGNEPTVWDLLDFINPLQHIPLVNLVYRELTGDKIGALPQIVGGAVLGGPIGAVSSIANVMVQEATGKDLGGHVMAMFDDGQPAAPAPRGRIEVVAPAAEASPAEPAPAATAAPAPAASASAHTATTGKFVPFAEAPADMLPTAQAAKGKPSAAFKPAPPRTTQTAPVSASALATPSPEAVKRAAAAQGLADADHPLVNPNPAAAEGDQAAGEALSAPAPIAPRRRAVSASDSAQPQANPANSSDFVNKFMSAMDKYDKASRLAAVPQPTSSRKQSGVD